MFHAHRLSQLKAAFAEAEIEISDEQLKDGINDLDTDGNGTLELDEFKQLAYQSVKG